MQREKMKYQKPVIHSIELDLVRHVATSGPNVGGGDDASKVEGGAPPMQSKPYDLWEYDDETYDDETAYEYGW